jgi:hypothetical protein
VSRPICRVIAFAIALRLVTAALALVTNVVFPDAQREQFTVYRRTNAFWDTFARNDSGWYLPFVHSSTLIVFSMFYVLCLALFANIHPLL